MSALDHAQPAGPPEDDPEARLLVVTTGPLERVPTPTPLPGLTVSELRLHRREDVSRWLKVFNEAYHRDWGRAQFDQYMAEHPDIEILRTFVAADTTGPVGVAAVGRYRRREDLGVGHYLGVVPRAKGTGAARLLVRHRYTALGEMGFDAAESQTHLWRVGSLRLHFECGFVPKPGIDRWNSPDIASAESRSRCQSRLQELHDQWRETLGTGPTRAPR